MIILGGLPKHHICNANMMHNGADYAVFINTAQDFDGSDSGARPDEAVSWGRICSSAESVKVHCDATIAFPLLVAKTFAAEKNHLSLLFENQLSLDQIEEEKNPAYRESVKCKIFLGFTSNLISSGVRDIIQYLVQHRMVDAIVTTTGGIEEDLIKCLADTYRDELSLPDVALRLKGLNRIYNLLVPNNNYCKFQDWVIPIFDQMLEEQKTKNDIPVFCPALTDGSLGDLLYYHLFRNPGLVVDIVQDIRAINGEAMHAKPRKTGMIILGGGLPKHHICNANLMRNGADYAVFINTAQEFDGSDSGASPDEAVSWGKYVLLPNLSRCTVMQLSRSHYWLQRHLLKRVRNQLSPVPDALAKFDFFRVVSCGMIKSITVIALMMRMNFTISDVCKTR
nr:deoxyhypusine synthase [Tanacetum cinerariifolium]